jgi:hypothetical protein
LRISQQWYEKVAHQRISDFLNQGKVNISELNNERVKNLLELAVKHPQNQDLLGEYQLFSIDPSDFKKYKKKKSQGVRWSGNGKSKYLTHDFVLSSFIYGESTIPFKKSLYWGKKSGKKRPTKAEIYLKLARKAVKWLKYGKQGIIVMDGEGCHKKILKAIHENKAWRGFVTKFPRTRNIIINGNKIHIRKYLANLTQSDFSIKKIKGKDISYHTFQATVPSLEFLGTCSFVVIQDEKNNLDQKTFRVLITDILSLTTEQILTIYARRWKQETYHQIIKCNLGVKSYQQRNLKAVICLLELADLAFSFLETQRLTQTPWQPSLSQVRNSIIAEFQSQLSVSHPLPLVA